MSKYARSKRYQNTTPVVHKTSQNQPKTVVETADAANSKSTKYELDVGDVFEGSVSGWLDSDWIKIDLEAGETYSFEAFSRDGGGRALENSVLKLYDSNGNLIRSESLGGQGRNALLEFAAKSSGTYYIAVEGTFFSPFGLFGSNTGSYGLSVTNITEPKPDNTSIETVDAAASTDTAYSVEVGGTFEGTIDSGRKDVDWIEIKLEANKTYNFEVLSILNTASKLENSTLRLYDGNGNLIDTKLGGGEGYHASMDFTPFMSGTYYLAVSGDNFSPFNLFGTTTGDYKLEVTEKGPQLPVFDHDQIADQLTNGYWKSLPFGDWRAFDVSPGEAITYSVTGLTEVGASIARDAFEAWEMMTGIEFKEVTRNAQITVDDNMSGAFSTSSVGLFSNTITSSFVNVSTSFLEISGTTFDSYTFQTFIHEIGHAIGLGHAGNYNGSSHYSPDGTGGNHYLNDSWQATLMSYFDQKENSFIDADRAFAVTPMIADIIAVQNLYGTAGNIRNGDTVYGFGSNAGGYYDDIFARDFLKYSPKITFTILDDGGNDTLNLNYGLMNDQVVDLNDESYSSILGGKGNLSIARGTIIENYIGDSGKDTVIGNEANNIIKGNDGQDTLDGGLGNDTLYGGKHADTFWFKGNGGRDTIKDFEDNVDSIMIEGYGNGSGVSMAQVQQNVVINFGNGNSLTIENTMINQVQDDILFL